MIGRRQRFDFEIAENGQCQLIVGFNFELAENGQVSAETRLIDCNDLPNYLFQGPRRSREGDR